MSKLHVRRFHEQPNPTAKMRKLEANIIGINNLLLNGPDREPRYNGPGNVGGFTPEMHAEWTNSLAKLRTELKKEKEKQQK